MRPLVSVIIPVFNTLAYLPKCVASVLAQTEPSLEVWLVDDGSTDGSADLCDELAAGDGRVRVIHLDNGGVSRARNMALAQATGEYVLFVDSDDWIDRGMVARLLALIKGAKADMATCGYVIEHADGRGIYRVDTVDERILSRAEALAMLFRPTHYRYKGNLWDKLFRRDLIVREGLRFEEGIAYNEDRLFVFLYLLHATAVAATTAPYYHYVIREGSAMAASAFHPRMYTFMDAFDRMTESLLSSSEAAASSVLRVLSEDYVASALKFFRTHAEEVGVDEFRRRMQRICRSNLSVLPFWHRIVFLVNRYRVLRVIRRAHP